MFLPPLKPHRIEHCRSVAKLSRELAAKLGCDPWKAELAGLLHDCAREIPREQMLSLAPQYGISVGMEEQSEPLLLHGPLAAAATAENFGIADKEILEAITFHTVGDVKMGTLAKIVFFADKTEPLRSYDGCDDLRELGFTDFDRAFALAVKGEADYCREQGYPIHPSTLELLKIID